MLLAFYTGNHSGDGWRSRLGWWLTQLVQKGPYGGITHVEAIHAEHNDGTVIIASASALDGGVRSKVTRLDPTHWLIVDVPQWDVSESLDLLARTDGQPYDWRGAWATVMPGHQQAGHWFCSQWTAFQYLKASGTFGPHQLAALCLSIGRDVTDDFFARQRRNDVSTKPAQPAGFFTPAEK